VSAEQTSTAPAPAHVRGSFLPQPYQRCGRPDRIRWYCLRVVGSRVSVPGDTAETPQTRDPPKTPSSSTCRLRATRKLRGGGARVSHSDSNAFDEWRTTAMTWVKAPPIASIVCQPDLSGRSWGACGETSGLPVTRPYTALPQCRLMMVRRLIHARERVIEMPAFKKEDHRLSASSMP
jgi:hypothetical protein